jgi:stage II sporulation protein D
MKETAPPLASSNDNSSYSEVKGDEFRILITETDKVVTLSANDYICGVVAAEIGAESSEEALKAQAVAAYTFACRKKGERTKERYDMCDDYKKDQAYLSTEQLKERWGENFEQYYNKVMSAVKSVEGEILTYDGKPILSIYHDISGGKTEAAENVWGEKYPCLAAVESVGDILSPNYLSTVTVGLEDMKKHIETLGGSLEGEPKDWFSDVSRSPSGYIVSLSVGGKEVKGTEVRTALDLRSTNFDVTFADDTFTFTVRGNGHGVGMSQYGAQFMALQGSNYKEILAWYYAGAVLQKST